MQRSLKVMYSLAVANKSLSERYIRSYSYAFNDKEKTNEIYGIADAYDYGARMYDPRLGRFMSTDPIVHSPQSPYNNSYNNPIVFVDPYGESGVIYLVVSGNTLSKLGKEEAEDIINQANMILHNLIGTAATVVLYNSSENGPFDPDNIDPTDTYIMLGDDNDLKQYEGKYNLSSNSTLDVLHPEESNAGGPIYNMNHISSLHKGGIINVDDAISMAKLLYTGKKYAYSTIVKLYLGYLVVHAASHNVAGDHIPGTLLANGDETLKGLTGGYLAGNKLMLYVPPLNKVSLLSYEMKSNRLFNPYIRAMGTIFMDNYKKNQEKKEDKKKKSDDKPKQLPRF